MQRSTTAFGAQQNSPPNQRPCWHRQMHSKNMDNALSSSQTQVMNRGRENSAISHHGHPAGPRRHRPPLHGRVSTPVAPSDSFSMNVNCCFQPPETVANLPRSRAWRSRPCLPRRANSECVPQSAQIACGIARQPFARVWPAYIFVLSLCNFIFFSSGQDSSLLPMLLPAPLQMRLSLGREGSPCLWPDHCALSEFILVELCSVSSHCLFTHNQNIEIYYREH